MLSASQYLDELQAHGRYSFSTREAIEATKSSPTATQSALRRLRDKGRIASPQRGFHVIVPPEHRRLGCRPAAEFVPDLMGHLELPYYATLLTAARYHGAGHQAAMAFQVMVATPKVTIQCGSVAVEFIVRSDMRQTPVVERNTATGVLRVATAAATALEVVGYPERSGYLDNVATVLADLAESIEAAELVAEAQRAPMAWVQRLGYLLTLVDAEDLAAELDPVIEQRGAFQVPLARWEDMVGAPRDTRWRVGINTEVDPDR